VGKKARNKEPTSAKPGNGSTAGEEGTVGGLLSKRVVERMETPAYKGARVCGVYITSTN